MLQGIKVHLDFETRSATDLIKSGVYRYAEDPTTWPWGFAYRFGEDGPWYQWRPGYPDPVALLAHVASGGTVTIHNAAFERTIWNWVIRTRICPHWPPMTIEQQDCTMSRAAAISHPQALERLAIALSADVQKDMVGNAVMRKLMRPRKFEADGSITWWDDPADVDRVMEYCGTDIMAESAIDALIPPLSDKERRVWELDQVINERGVRFDMPIVERAAQLVDYTKKQNDKVMRDITDRAVPKCSNDAKIIVWLNARGVECTSLAKGEIDDVVFMAQTAYDDTALQVIKLRQASWKTSTAKYRAMQKCVNADDRIRGLLNYHGAGTGRWAGRLVQPQNFRRVDPDDEALQGRIAWLHELFASNLTIAEIYEHLEAVYGPLEPMELLSQALRSMIVAAEGKMFVGGDFSNIEGRGNAWLAGETWKLQAFQAYDDGTGPDLYKLAYARSFGVDVNTIGKGPQRQIGKVQELALGYQGSIGAYMAMGATYGVNPFDLSSPVEAATSAEQWDRTALGYHAPGVNKYQLFEREWTALKILVDNWRAANPAIVQSWWNYQDAAVEAVAAPGNVVHPEHTRLVYFYSDGRMLWCALPSGRMLSYASPEVVQEVVEYVDKATGETRTRIRRKVTYWSVNSVTRQWAKSSLYGGLQCENIVSGTARDVMVDAMFRLEALGFPICLSVHDELLSEVDKHSNYHTADKFAAIMSEKDDVYAGLPLSVGAWKDKRYVK
jgi:DNA polymerase